MVKIVDFQVRHNAANEPFVALILQGDLVLVQSSESGRWYATAKKTSITSTFSEEEAKALIGRELSGRIEKLACEPYEYTLEDTGEVITLSHRWDFMPEETATPLRAVKGGLAA